MSRPVRVLVVDDSAVVRTLLSRGLAVHPQIEVVGTAVDAYDARDKIVALEPDVLTLDVEMPRMDGIQFLRLLNAQRPMPVVMVSSLTQPGTRRAVEALAAGAIAVVAKPSGDAGGLRAVVEQLRREVLTAAAARVRKQALEPRRAPRKPRENQGPPSRQVIAVGASTGGPQALANLVSQLDPEGPGIVIVQHMPAAFTGPFAERLGRHTGFVSGEAVDGDVVCDGSILVAPGDRHIRLERRGNGFCVRTDQGALVSGHRPSVDVLFASAAKAAGGSAVGVLLTGMGADGAKGLLQMRRRGAVTIAQDEGSCVVFGMPGVAVAMGAATRVVPLDDIGASIAEALPRLRAA